MDKQILIIKQGQFYQESKEELTRQQNNSYIINSIFKHMNSKNQDQISTSPSIPSSTSISGNKLSPSTMQQAIAMLKKQIRQLKFQRQQHKQSHEQQISSYIKQIQSLKKKIISMSEKQYLKSILMQQAQDQKIKQKQLQNQLKKQKVYQQKLEAQLKQKQNLIQKQQQQILDLKKQNKILQKQKQRHLQLNIIQKLNLQQRIQILQKQIKSKQNLLNNIQLQSIDITNKQIKLNKLQRKLNKKVNQLEEYQYQVKDLNSFEKQKMKKRIESLEKENTFLKEHLSNIEEKFASINQECFCENSQCRKEIDMFKNKYINKSRELSKVKVELSKEMFKEQFLKQVKNKENLTMSLQSKKLKDKRYSEKILQKTRTKLPSYDLQASKKSYGTRQQQEDDILLFKLTQNDDQIHVNENRPPSLSASKSKLTSSYGYENTPFNKKYEKQSHLIEDKNLDIKCTVYKNQYR